MSGLTIPEPSALANRERPRRTGTSYWLGRILDAESLDPVETLLLIALADHIDQDDEAYVAIDKLAARARTSYVTARRRLTGLEERGYIARTRRRRGDGNLSVYTYRLIREPFEPALNLSGDHRSPERSLTIAHPGERAEVVKDEVVKDEEDLTHSRESLFEQPEPTPKPDPVAVAFATWWSHYPRKESKAPALKKFPAALKKAGSLKVLIDGADRYRDDPNRVPRFTKHPDRWLNAECWDDPPLPPNGNGNGHAPRAPYIEDESRRTRPGGVLTDAEIWGET